MLSKIFKSRKKKVRIFKIFDFFFIKNKKKILIVVKSSVDFGGNLRIAIEEFIKLENNFDIYLYKDGYLNNESKNYLYSKKVTVLEGFSLKNIFHIATSGVVIVGHSIRDAHISTYYSSRFVVNLWHGVIFKNIELLMKNIEESKKSLIYNNSKLYNLITASSVSDSKHMKSAFGVRAEVVSVTGLLRYEILKNSYKSEDKSINSDIELIESIKGNMKLVLYAPTFRESKSNVVNNLDFNLISEVAKENNFVFCIRLHPYTSSIDIKDKFSNLFFINNDIIKETNILLKYVDILVVDYSSIWIDFLLLNKPIVMFTPDIDNYVGKERDFSYNIKEIVEFSVHRKFSDVLQEVLILLKKKNIIYTSTKNLFHQYNLDDNYRKIFINTFNNKYQEYFHE